MKNKDRFPDALDIVQLFIISFILFIWAAEKMVDDLLQKGANVEVGIWGLAKLLLNPENFKISSFVFLPVEPYVFLFYSLLVVYALSIFYGFLILLSWIEKKRAYRRWRN